MKLKKMAVLSLALTLCGAAATYVAAQAQKPAPTQQDAGAGAVAGSCPHMGMDCPMCKLVELAQVKVEKTRTGASVQLTANDASKILEVQALAEKLGERVKAGCCSMMSGKPGLGHGHPHHGKAP